MRGLSNLSTTTSTGTTASAASVTCHDSANIALTTTMSNDTSDVTVATVPTVACAPTTSEFMRLNNAPVWVRVKNAKGSFWTCSNMPMRRSKIRPSPMREPNHRETDRSAVSPNAKATASMNSRLTCARLRSGIAVSIRRRKTSGGAAATSDVSTMLNR